MSNDNTEQNDILMSPYVELYKSRNILLTGMIDSEVASAVIAQLLSLEAHDPDDDITIYIDSPGGLKMRDYQFTTRCRF